MIKAFGMGGEVDGAERWFVAMQQAGDPRAVWDWDLVSKQECCAHPGR